VENGPVSEIVVPRKIGSSQDPILACAAKLPIPSDRTAAIEVFMIDIRPPPFDFLSW
jgi:hypothetical protein